MLLVPDAWNTDVLVVTRPAGLEITLDGGVMADGLFAPIDDGTYEVARVVTSDGVHELTAEQPFAVAVVGYDLDDSYAYLGGAGIAVINPEPAG